MLQGSFGAWGGGSGSADLSWTWTLFSYAGVQGRGRTEYDTKYIIILSLEQSTSGTKKYTLLYPCASLCTRDPILMILPYRPTVHKRVSKDHQWKTRGICIMHGDQWEREG